MNMKRKYILFAAALAVTASACEKVPSSDEFDGEFLVYTARSETADFSAYTSFTVADSIFVIDGETGSFALNDWGKSLRSQYIKELKSCGYTYVDTGKLDNDYAQDAPEGNKADLAVQISYVVSTSYFTAHYPVNPYWWASYPGYWYPGYWGDWGYWYYSFPVTYSYSTHSLLTEMVDLTAEPGADTPLPVVWNSYIDGSIGSTRGDAARFTRAVTQSFEQSEYLDRN